MNFIINSIFDGVGELFKAAIKYWYVTLAVILLCIGYWLWHGWSEAEKKAENAVATDNQIRVDKAETNANIAGNIANNSVNAANRARKANINSFNSNFDETRKQYCIQFPEDCQ